MVLRKPYAPGSPTRPDGIGIPNQIWKGALMKTTALPKSTTSRRAAAVAEFALVLPFLVFAFVAATDFARIFYYSIAVNNCARNGALYGSADTTHALDTAGIQSAAQVDAINLALSQFGVSSSADSATSPTSVTVTVTYVFSTITSYPGIPSQMTLSRTVQMSVVPATPKFN
jgi:Flp pilus assembly protein TadG